MAHFAKINDSSQVLQVLTIENDKILNEDGDETESIGQQWLETHNNWPAAQWIQTSYNTKENQHQLGGTPLRGNYAAIGYTWDSVNQIFWFPQLHGSWTKNNSTASWEAPIPYPSVTEYTEDSVAVMWEISWDEDTYQGDNTRGWKATKVRDENRPKIQYNWNGTSWE